MDTIIIVHTHNTGEFSHVYEGKLQKTSMERAHLSATDSGPVSYIKVAVKTLKGSLHEELYNYKAFGSYSFLMEELFNAQGLKTIVG